MFYTGYYANIKRMKKGKFRLVSISRTIPEWFQDEFIPEQNITLAPDSFAEVELLRKQNNLAKTRYEYKIQKMTDAIKERYNDNLDTIFLCHEKDSHQCHRMLFRNVLNAAGIPCKEIYFEKDGSYIFPEEEKQLSMEDML